MTDILNMILNSTTVYFLSILFLNIFSSCLGTLKSIYTAKQAGNITYLLVLIDATVYSLVLKSFSSEGSLSIIAFIIGKLVGTVLADVLEKKIAIGINDVYIYVSSYDQMLAAQRQLFADGFSTTASIGLVDEYKHRHQLHVHVARKNMSGLLESLNKAGIENPTMTIKELKSVSGKIAKRI